MQKQASAQTGFSTPIPNKPGLRPPYCLPSNHSLCWADSRFLPSEAFQLPEPPSFSKPQHKASEREAGIRTQFSFLLASGTRRPEEDFALGALCLADPWGSGGEGDTRSSVPCPLSSCLPHPSTFRMPEETRYPISEPPGCCYFYVKELSRFKLEGDISSLIGTFKRLLSHSAAPGLCN